MLFNNHCTSTMTTVAEASPACSTKAVVHSSGVAIIGAGVAGLCAANNFLSHNFHDFVLIEARNRLGGRVVAINIEGRQLELGATFIHGVLGNPMYEIASANGFIPIIQESKPHTVVAAREDGSKVSFSLLQEMYEVYGTFFKRCEEYFLCSYSPPEGISSVAQHLIMERDLYLSKFSEMQQADRKLIFNHLMNRESIISGTDLGNVDLTEIGSYTELPGGNIVLPGGYSSILRPLTKDIPSDKIFKGHQVDIIEWGNKDKQVEIVCENGSTFLVNSVICTVPLGVLKTKHQSMFNPSLPDYKINSLDKLCFGVVDKIYLEYDRPFMRPDLKELVILWEENPASDHMADNWFRKIYSFTKLDETLLLAWVSGDEAKYMEALPFEVVGKKCTEILRRFLADPCVPEPKRCICTSWWSQPYSRGSYTSIQVGGSHSDIINIATPLYATDNTTPRLLFAGEHCHPSYYSTVHGAYLSGRNAAESLYSSINRKPHSTPLTERVPVLKQEKPVLVLDGASEISSTLKRINLQ